MPYTADALVLYHCAGARSLRALWALKELGISQYRLITMPFPPRVQCREYLKVNRLGTVPCLIHGATKLTESCAIPLYLAHKFAPESPLLLKPSHPEYGGFLNLLFQSDATLTFPQTLVLRYEQFEKERGFEQIGKDYRKWYLARLRFIDSILADSSKEYLIANRFTLADLCVTYALWLGKRNNLDGEYQPSTREYMNRVIHRSAFVEALAEESKSLEAFDPNSAFPAVSGLWSGRKVAQCIRNEKENGLWFSRS